MRVVHFPSAIPGRKGETAVLELEVTSAARRLRVAGFDGLEALDPAGAATGGTYTVPDGATRFSVPLRVTRDGPGRARVRVTLEDPTGAVAPETWVGETTLSKPRASGSTGKKVGLVLALATVAGLVAFFVLPLFRMETVPPLVGQTRDAAERILASKGWKASVRRQDVTSPSDDRRVRGVWPSPGTALEKDATVELVVGHYVGGATPPAPIPTPAPANPAPAAPVPSSLPPVAPTPTDVPAAPPPGPPPAPPPDDASPSPASKAPRPTPESTAPPPAPESATARDVPDVVMMSKDDAVQALADLRFSSTVTEEDVTEKDGRGDQAGRVVRQVPAAGSRAPEGSAVRLVVGRAPKAAPIPKVRVPDVVGRPSKEAVSVVADAGLAASVTFETVAAAEAGTVTRQAPAAGEEIERGSRVSLTVGRAAPEPVVAPTAPPPESTRPTAPTPPPTPTPAPTPTPEAPPPPAPVKAPDLVGMARPAAEARLRDAGLEARVTYEDVEAPIAEGIVLSQTPPADETTDARRGVELVVSRRAGTKPEGATAAAPADGQVSVPDVLGLAGKDAIRRLTDAGLKVRSVRGDEGTAVTQVPAGGETLARGATVHVWISSEAEPATGLVPKVEDLAGSDAVSSLVASGFAPVAVPDPDPRGEPGRVRSQAPNAETKLVLGSHVRVHVASSDEVAKDVLDATGLATADARARLEAKGHRVVVVRAAGRGLVLSWAAPETVVAQWPRGMVNTAETGTVTLWVVAH